MPKYSTPFRSSPTANFIPTVNEKVKYKMHHLKHYQLKSSRTALVTKVDIRHACYVRGACLWPAWVVVKQQLERHNNRWPILSPEWSHTASDQHIDKHCSARRDKIRNAYNRSIIVGSILAGKLAKTWVLGVISDCKMKAICSFINVCAIRQ
jgi:hypothetical protein